MASLRFLNSVAINAGNASNTTKSIPSKFAPNRLTLIGRVTPITISHTKNIHSPAIGRIKASTTHGIANSNIMYAISFVPTYNATHKIELVSNRNGMKLFSPNLVNLSLLS